MGGFSGEVYPRGYSSQADIILQVSNLRQADFVGKIR
jgi:hypothetical protein